MKCLAVITLALLVLTGCQTTDYAAELKRIPAFTPDYKVGRAAYYRKHYATALKHFRPLAKQGHAKAQSSLGAIYHNGEGVAKDYKETVRWWRKAAKQGNVSAERWLASLEKKLRAEGNWPPRSRQAKAKPAFTPDYKVGRAAYERKDHETALRHFRPLAEQGNADAQDRLGGMYKYGKGVTKDLKEAYRWYRKGAKQGSAKVQAHLANLEKKLRAEDNWPPKTRKAKAPGSPSSDIEARLLKLQELEKKGLITKEDATRKRKELLDKL